MAIEIIQGGRKNQERQQFTIPDQPSFQPGLLEKSLYYPLRGLEKTGRGIAQLISTIGGFPLAEVKQPTEQILEKIGATPESFAPTNLLETFVKHAGESAIPSLAFGGIPGILNMLAGSTLATGGAALGASEPTQQALKLGGELLSGRIGHKIPEIIEKKLGTKVPEGLFGGLPTMGRLQQRAYNAARAAAEKAQSTEAPEIAQGLNKIVSALETEPNEQIISKIEKMVQRAGDLIKEGITPNRVLEARTKLNKFSQGLPQHIREEYITPLRQGYNDFLANYSAQNAQFGDQLDFGDRITAMKNVGSTISDYINKIPNFIGGDIVKIGLKGLSKLGAEQGEKLIKRIALHPTTALPYYFNMAKAAFSNDPLSFMENLKNLSTTVSPLIGISNKDAMSIFREKPKSSLKIVKGRRK